MVDNFAKNLILLLVVSLSAMSCGTIVGMQSVNEPPWWPFEINPPEFTIPISRIEEIPPIDEPLDFASQYVGTSFPGEIITLNVGDGQLIGIRVEPKIDPMSEILYNRVTIYESIIDDEFKNFVNKINQRK